MTSNAYQELETRFRRIGLINDAASMLHWDAATYMPKGSGSVRGDQLANLAVIAHENLSGSDVASWLDEAEGSSDDLDAWQRANLREMRRSWIHNASLPSRLVEALTKASNDTELTWRDARANADFALVEGKLSALVELVKEQAAALSEALDVDAYDALIDSHEPGGRTAHIDPIFDDYAAFLPDFLEAVLAKQAAEPSPKMPSGPFPIEQQKALSEKVMALMAFPFDRGRLDISTHPFTGGVPDDVRITTRYEEADFASSLMGTIHETGHALYEAGLPVKWRGQPVGGSRGMTLHESQSLLMEMQAGRSKAFLSHLASLAAEQFGADPAWERENLFKLYTKVERGFIRVDADEVTYPAHVILRYRLERALFAGDLQVADLPGAWNEGSKALLGVTPPDDQLGVLQDIHWYSGGFGYFPTYSLGAMSAAQLFQAAKADIDGLDGQMAAGDFNQLIAWLRRHVHEQASLSSTNDVLEQATGQPLTIEPFKAHLKQRYLGEG